MPSLIVPDINLLVYAYDEKSPDFLASRNWWEKVLTEDSVGLPIVSILGFIRLTTHPKVPGRRFSVEEAHAIVESWLARPNVNLLSPGPSHFAIFRRLSSEMNGVGNLSTDAHLATLAIEHDGELCSKDSDFSLFPGLHWTNPLVPRV